jgi:hypothetical protein
MVDARRLRRTSTSRRAVVDVVLLDGDVRGDVVYRFHGGRTHRDTTRDAPEFVDGHR